MAVLCIGLNFALLSGTSMATPHVAGIAALIKQRNPTWTPSMIMSAIATTATKYDKNGRLIMAEGFGIASLNPSTPLELGSGLVTPGRAIDPGLIFYSGDISKTLVLKKKMVSELSDFVILQLIEITNNGG